MQKQKLTEVPDHILVRPSRISPNKKWRSDYNVAAWFRFEKITVEPIKLYLCWQDASGSHSACVDHSLIKASSLLLSGVVQLKITGQLKEMAVVAETNNARYLVDELYVQPTAESTSVKSAS